MDVKANTLPMVAATTVTLLIGIVTWNNQDSALIALLLDSRVSGQLFNETAFWTLLASLFAIMNPLVAVPFFAAITEGHSQSYRERLTMTATFAVMVALVLAALLGNEILQFFSISIGAFRIAGGIIVLLMGLSLIKAECDSKKAVEGKNMQDKDDSRSQAVCPIAIPLLAGPGAIATIIVQCEGASTTADYVTLAAVLLVMIAIVYVTLRLAVPVARFLGDTGLTVATRLFGMLVIAIAIDMAIIGFGLLFPQSL
jgi:multiple antibiotic resistance protein